MKKLAVILLVLGAAAAVPGIILMISANFISDGWGALARSSQGLLLIGLALLLAASGGALFLDIHIKNKRKGKHK